MVKVLGVHFMADGRYPGRHVAEAQREAGKRGVKQDYYSRAIEAGEPPGRWMGPGLEALGLTLGTEVSQAQMDSIYTQLCDPRTGESIGTPLRHYAGAAENLVKAAHRRGAVLPDDLTAPAVRAALEARETSEVEVIGRVAAALQPEELAAIKRDASRSQRKARTFVDLTASPDKSWSVFHAAAEASGDFDTADAIEAAQRDGHEAMLEVLMREAGYSRAGYHGAKVGGRTSGRWVEGKEWIVASFTHHLSREGDPQLHTHLAVLNRVQCPDGVWRALDGQAIERARPLAAAIYERAAEESLVRRLGVRFETSPDGKSRRIVGVDQETIDLFSKRSASINARLDEWARSFEARNGRAPDERERDAAARQIAMTKRRAKPAEMDTRTTSLQSWDEELSASRGQSLRQVYDGVRAECRTVLEEAPAAPVSFDHEAVIAAAIADVSSTRAQWTRYDLAGAVNRALPDGLGGRTGDEVDALLEVLVNEALVRGQVTQLTAPDVIGAVPESLRRPDGGSIYSPRDDLLYGLTETLSQEQRLVGRALGKSAPVVSERRAARHVARASLREDQAAAVVGVLTSGRSLEVLIGPAGTGKSYTLAALAQAWESESGRGSVVGLALSESAAGVLRHEGLPQSFNIARWLGAQERHRLGRPMKDDPPPVPAGGLIVVDEASMVSTAQLFQIAELARPLGAKVVLAGDHCQLAAVETGGLLKLLVEDREVRQEGGVHELVEVARFSAEWEREASLRLRDGDESVLDLYDRHGRIEGGTEAEMLETSYQAYVTDVLNDLQSVLVVPTGAQAAAMGTRVRNELVRLGRVSNEVTAVLHNGCVVGAGDAIQARRNDFTTLDPTGRPVCNRDVFVVVAVDPAGSLAVRRQLGVDDEGRAQLGDPFKLAAGYVSADVELAYAVTVHGAQGRTVDTAHGLIDAHATRESVYVTGSRGRHANHWYVVTETPEVESIGEADKIEPDPQWFLTEALRRSGATASATATMREQFDAAVSLARLGPIWSDVCGEVLVERHKAALTEVLGPEQVDQVLADPAATALWRALDEVHAEGRDVAEVLASAVNERELGSAESIAKVLHHRVARTFDAPETSRTSLPTFVQRTPAANDDERREYAQRVAEAMDNRLPVLGARVATDAPDWAVEAWGQVPAHPGDRSEWERRAAVVEAYREQYGGRDDVADPIGPRPARLVSPDRYLAWRAADAALARPQLLGRDVADLSSTELRGLVGAWKDAQQDAPPFVADHLRRARRELRDTEGRYARLRAVDERTAQRVVPKVEEARDTVERFDQAQTERDEWWNRTEEVRRLAGEAHLELQQRGDEAEVDHDLSPEQVREAMTERELERLERRLDADTLQIQPLSRGL